jgi:DNA-binding MurR/RpiR family transcriptional regulator
MKFMDRMAKAADALTQREKALADYLIANYPQGLLESATDIARHVGISASTVVRFFAKLDYASFPDAQREARIAVSSKMASPVQRAGVALRHENSLQAVLDESFLIDRTNIDATREGLDLADVDGMVRTLARSSGRVFVVGEKNSHAIAHYLHIHLNLCLPNVQMLDTRQSVIADNLVWLTDKDVVLAISIRRYSRQVLQAAQYARQIGGKVLAITDSPLAPIAGLAHHRAVVHTASASPFDSYTAAYCLCNALVAAISLRRRKEIEATIQRSDEIWRRFGTFIEHDGPGAAEG